MLKMCMKKVNNYFFCICRIVNFAIFRPPHIFSAYSFESIPSTAFNISFFILCRYVTDILKMGMNMFIDEKTF